MKELIEQLLNNIISDITQEMSAKKFNASGVTVSSMEGKVTEDSGEFIAPLSMMTLVKGRKPGKQPPSNAIRDWIDSKGIQPKGITKDQLAFVIARKIGSRGNDIFLGKKSKLEFEKIVTINLDLFQKDVADNISDKFSEQILKNLNKSFKAN